MNATPETPLPDASLKTILIIDDDVHLGATLALGLETNGYRTLCATNADDGWKLAQAHLPDLILCDIDMPGKDGHLLLQELRADPELASLQFVLMTGKLTLGNQRAGMDLGADDFLLKPFSLATLTQCVAARLKRVELSRRIDDRVLERLRESLHTSLPHEFFTPLATILGLTELLQLDLGKLTPEEVQQDLGDIHNAGRRLHRTLRNYLFLLELEPEGAPRPMALLDPTEVIDALKGGVAAAASRHQRATDVVAEFAATSVQALPVDLATLVEELVDNALSYSRKDTPVHVRSWCEGQKLHLTVTDHGRGLTPPQLERLQQMGPVAAERHRQPTPGFGLVIVRRLVQLLGGTFRLESEAGEGTTCHVTLPVAAG